MKESGNLAPEVELEERASVYKVIPYKASYEELVLTYNTGVWMRWSLNENNFNIKLWPETKGLHKDVDPEGYQAKTTGYVSKSNGFLFQWEVDNNKRAEVEFAIKKYLKSRSH